MPRFAAISLVNLRIELAHIPNHDGFGGADALAPLAVVIAHPGGAVKDETSLLGNTRLDEVSPAVFELGIRPGQTVASARARSADLRVRVVPLESVEKTLAGIAEMALAFGPTVAFTKGSFAGDVVWVDVTGCGHLHASPGENGELALLTELAGRVFRLGHACRVAIADGPHVAAAVARFAAWGRDGASPAPPERGPRKDEEARVVARGGNAEALGNLPLAALGLEEKTFAWMSALGLRRVADLQRIPRAALAVRLGSDAARVMALLEGDDRAPLVAYVPPEAPSEEALLEYGIESSEALLFVAKRLAGRLAARLLGRCQKATRLELLLGLDLGTSLRESQRLEVVLALPLACENELFAVLRTKIEAEERVSGGVPFKAPIVSVLLRASEVVTARPQALDLLEPEAKAERALPKLATELVAELGPERVGTLALANSWVMVDRSRLLPYGLTRATPPPSSLLSGGVEPTRILAEPKDVKRSSLLHSRLVARFEAVKWWLSRAPSASSEAGPRQKGRERIEHYASWVEGKRAMAWVELEGEGAKVLGFLD